MFYVIQTTCPNICQRQTTEPSKRNKKKYSLRRISKNTQSNPACATNEYCKAKPSQTNAIERATSTAAAAAKSTRQPNNQPTVSKNDSRSVSAEWKWTISFINIKSSTSRIAPRNEEAPKSVEMCYALCAIAKNDALFERDYHCKVLSLVWWFARCTFNEEKSIARQQSASFHFFARTYNTQSYFETIKTFWINERREVM